MDIKALPGQAPAEDPGVPLGRWLLEYLGQLPDKAGLNYNLPFANGLICILLPQRRLHPEHRGHCGGEIPGCRK